ncbi:hypothetical protein V6615_00970 [Oscillospiraceae bacterium PP1C4]
MNDLWKTIIDAAIGSVFAFLIGVIVNAIKIIFQRVGAHGKKKHANNDLINYFHNTITSEGGSLNHILYNEQRLILAQKYHTNMQIFLSYDELEQHLLNDAEKTPFIDLNSLRKIKERIMQDKSGSVTIEGLGYMLLITMAGVVFCEAIKQIQTNTFVITFGKIIGFLLAAFVLIYHYWHKRNHRV